MRENCIKIAIIDDHPLMRAGVAVAFEQAHDCRVVAEGRLSVALQVAADHRPDVIVIGVNSEGGGLVSARKIAIAFPHIHVIFLTISERKEDAKAALESGVRGYVAKSVNAQELARIVRSVCTGETYITPNLAVKLLGMPGDNIERMTFVSRDLSSREEQILEGVAQGLTNREIACSMTLSERTIKHHMTGLMRKLRVRNRVEAVLLLRSEPHASTLGYSS